MTGVTPKMLRNTCNIDRLYFSVWLLLSEWYAGVNNSWMPNTLRASSSIFSVGCGPFPVRNVSGVQFINIMYRKKLEQWVELGRFTVERSSIIECLKTTLIRPTVDQDMKDLVTTCGVWYKCEHPPEYAIAYLQCCPVFLSCSWFHNRSPKSKFTIASVVTIHCLPYEAISRQYGSYLRQNPSKSSSFPKQLPGTFLISE